MSSEPCRIRGRDRVIRAFSMLEILIVCVVVSIVMALAVPAIRSSSRKATQVKCLANLRQTSELVLQYCADYRDRFPARYADHGPDLLTPLGISRYRGQKVKVWGWPMWQDYSGYGLESPIYRCPANVPSRHAMWSFHSNWSLSASLYIEPGYLDPLRTTASFGSSIGAQIQTLANVRTPSEKVGVYESDIWHEYPGMSAPGADFGLLEYYQSTKGGSVVMLDGHGERRIAMNALPYVRRFPYWPAQPFGTTAWGVLGRD